MQARNPIHPASSAVDGYTRPPTQPLLRRPTMTRFDFRWTRFLRIAFLRRFLRAFWNNLMSYSLADRGRYHRLNVRFNPLPLVAPEGVERSSAVVPADVEAADPDLVSLKISLLGDSKTGKTSFMTKYVGDLEVQRGLRDAGLNLRDKVLVVQGARIAFSIWDVGGDDQFLNHVPVACKDAVAIVIMFDLTNRSSLNNVIGWHQRARKWNKTAIPLLVGSKFDEFVQLPLEVQWTIVNQARVYAKAMKATLFFSSASHNININKIFKFIAAKLFNLPLLLERNLTLGEPIVDF